MKRKAAIDMKKKFFRTNICQSLKTLNLGFIIGSFGVVFWFYNNFIAQVEIKKNNVDKLWIIRLVNCMP